MAPARRHPPRRRVHRRLRDGRGAHPRSAARRPSGDEGGRLSAWHAALPRDASVMSTAVGGFSLRLEAPADAAAVGALLQASFGRPAEAALVDRLRAEGAI